MTIKKYNVNDFKINVAATDMGESFEALTGITGVNSLDPRFAGTEFTLSLIDLIKYAATKSDAKIPEFKIDKSNK